MSELRCRPGPKPHGYRGTLVYRIWSNMIQRCTNPKNIRYARYGGRGISVCQRWRDVRAFVADMGIPMEGMSIDRINNDGNYEPGNCRWASAADQARNTSRNVRISLGDESLCAAEWASKLGIPSGTIHERLRVGMTAAEALSVESLANITPVAGMCPLTGVGKQYPSVASTAVDGFNPRLVSHCINGRQKTHRGWKWEILTLAGKPQEVVGI